MTDTYWIDYDDYFAYDNDDDDDHEENGNDDVKQRQWWWCGHVILQQVKTYIETLVI